MTGESGELPRPPRQRLTDSHVGELVERIRARILVFLAVGFMLVVLELVLWKKGHIGASGFLLALVATPLLLYGMTGLLLWSLDRAGTGLARILFSTAGEGHSREYSEQQALVVAGRIAEAIDSFQAHLVAFPADVEARLRLASLQSGPAGQSAAAERVLIEARSMTLTPRQELVIANTLIDLYRATGQRHQLKAELARFARIHHGSDAGEQARLHLRHLVEEDHRVT